MLQRRSPVLVLGLLFSAATPLACDAGETEEKDGAANAAEATGEPNSGVSADDQPTDGGSFDAGGNDTSSSSSPSKDSAILLAGQVYTPDDYLTYIGLFAEVPEGDVGFRDFREFGNANASIHDGRVFVDEAGIMQRFDVDDDLQLVDGPRFSWTDFGITTANAVSTVFISKTRAYTFAPALDVIVVWNPDTMERTGAIDADFPERPEDMETWASDGYVVGDKVIWNVFSGSFDSGQAHPAVTLAIADAHENTTPKYVEDPRCLPGGPAFLDGDGDYYVHGGGYFGYFFIVGDNPGGIRTCALRVNAGETDFDSEFLLDYEQATGSPVNTFWIRVSEDEYVTRAWDPDVPLPTDADEVWAGAGLRAVLVNQKSGTFEPYPDLDGTLDIDGTTRIVDGISYFQVSETGYDVGGNTDVVELHPDGIRSKFHLTDGFLLTLERVR